VDASIGSGGLSPSKIAGTAVVTADSRLSDARTPSSTLSHASTHHTAGSDALAPADIGAQVSLGTDVNAALAGTSGTPSASNKFVTANDAKLGLNAPIPRGTAFPVSPAPSTGDVYYRTDLIMLCQFDGTRWLSHQIFLAVASSPAQSSSSPNWTPPIVMPTGDVFCIDETFTSNINTSHGSVSYWTLTDWITGLSIPSDKATVGAWVTVGPIAINAVKTVARGNMWQVAKSGAPGNIQFAAMLRYRLIVT